MELADPDTGELTTVYPFVGTLPFGRYSYVEPALDMKEDTWPLRHVRMFEYFGGSTACVTCDNLRTGAARHPREGEVVLNEAYQDMAAHYCAAVLRLTHKHRAERVEAACKMAPDSGVRSPRYAHIKPILVTNRDKMASAAEADAQATGYVRGADYYGGNWHEHRHPD
jgi:hypothetical protein